MITLFVLLWLYTYCDSADTTFSKNKIRDEKVISGQGYKELQGWGEYAEGISLKDKTILYNDFSGGTRTNTCDKMSWTNASKPKNVYKNRCIRLWYFDKILSISIS